MEGGGACLQWQLQYRAPRVMESPDSWAMMKKKKRRPNTQYRAPRVMESPDSWAMMKKKKRRPNTDMVTVEIRRRRGRSSSNSSYSVVGVRCSSSNSGSGGWGTGIGIGDLIGGDLVKLDLGRWLSDVEEHKALAIYSPHEGGYEGRYLNRLRYQGYHFLDLSARGLGDPETTLIKIHPVCPAHLGKQPIARWYFPPEVDYRLSLLPPNAKGLVLWIIEAKVLSKSELQFLALLPTLRPNVRVIAECGNWRKFMWKPLKEIAALTGTEDAR